MYTIEKNIIPHAILIASLLPGLAQADATTCFNFLDAQDYARAESEAKQLLQRGNLDRSDERYAQLCLGRAYNSMGRTRDALPALQRVEALSQTTKELAVIYNSLGLTYAGLSDLDRAELYDQRALKAFHELGDKKNSAITLNNLALVVKERGDLERALQLYREALAMQPEAEQASTLNNIALIHGQRKEYQQAIKLLRQAIAIDRRNGDAHAAAHQQINLGDILREAKQYPAAEKELLAGLNAIRLVGDKYWEAAACERLGWLTSTKDNPKRNVGEARQWLEKAEALYREIGDIESANSIATYLGEK
ncbi:MAG: tetratricopeptide repeat protein [Nitrosomonadales bacterium]|nr:tetratricopeptide repeat protein [Nitrosomonadales bacterium]